MNRPAPFRALARPAAAFARGERGSLTILGLVMFMLMLVAGGIALDVMRSEVQRTELQTAIDRGVLASASLDQSRDAETVMRDYLRAAGIDQSTVQITAFDDGAKRSVAVDAMARTPSLFMDLLGVEELRQPILASALEERTELELSLVVDISGSMQGDKINRLRLAANDFVAKLLQGREARTYVSLVPYNETVNLGSIMPRYFPMTTEHNYSRCAVFANAAFSRMDLPPGTLIQRKGHFDKNSTSMKYGPIRQPECPTDDTASVLLWSTNVAELQRRIAALSAGGSTAINVGAKVGTLLLDPTSRSRLKAMVDDTTVPDAQRVDRRFRDIRPVDYRTAGAHKVLVLMTDGENNWQNDLRAEFRSGPSWVAVAQDRIGQNCDNDGDPSDCSDYDAANPAVAREPFGSPLNPNSANGQPSGARYEPRYSFWSISRNKWYVHHTRTWEDAPWGGTDARRIDWPILLANRPIKEMALGLLKDADKATRDQYWEFKIFNQTHPSKNAIDDELSAICAAARAKGVVIYTIAFQAPAVGRDAMRACAGPGNEKNYFDVQGLDIESAFSDVLAAVNRLRLTR